MNNDIQNQCTNTNSQVNESYSSRIVSKKTKLALTAFIENLFQSMKEELLGLIYDASGK